VANRRFAVIITEFAYDRKTGVFEDKTPRLYTRRFIKRKEKNEKMLLSILARRSGHHSVGSLGFNT
jgi:hypothetical protein